VVRAVQDTVVHHLTAPKDKAEFELHVTDTWGRRPRERSDAQQEAPIQPGAAYMIVYRY